DDLREVPLIDVPGDLELAAGHANVAAKSKLASFNSASRSCQLTAATSASSRISLRTWCPCGRWARTSLIAAMYSPHFRIVRSVPPYFVGRGGVSLARRYAGRNTAERF